MLYNDPISLTSIGNCAYGVNCKSSPVLLNIWISHQNTNLDATMQYALVYTLLDATETCMALPMRALFGKYRTAAGVFGPERDNMSLVLIMCMTQQGTSNIAVTEMLAMLGSRQNIKDCPAGLLPLLMARVAKLLFCLDLDMDNTAEKLGCRFDKQVIKLSQIESVKKEDFVMFSNLADDSGNSDEVAKKMVQALAVLHTAMKGGNHPDLNQNVGGTSVLHKQDYYDECARIVGVMLKNDAGTKVHDKEFDASDTLANAANGAVGCLDQLETLLNNNAEDAIQKWWTQFGEHVLNGCVDKSSFATAQQAFAQKSPDVAALMGIVVMLVALHKKNRIDILQNLLTETPCALAFWNNGGTCSIDVLAAGTRSMQAYSTDKQT